jgi:uncharacterized protein YbjT (DUF2867 family)
MRGDLLDRASVAKALHEVDAAYYLVHSMNSGNSFEEIDRQAAQNFAEAARRAQVRRVVYLGGLSDADAPLSAHLRSRHEVGGLLRESGAQVIEFRSSIIIGAGSLSFEMVRALGERLPIMIMPRWVMMQAQPIAIRDVVAYLMAARAIQLQGNHTFEIGGATRASYGEIIGEYARQRGLRRVMIPVPVLTPRLSSWWLKLVTPLQARVGRELIEGVKHRTIVRDDSAERTFAVKPVGIRQAIADALRDEDEEFLTTRWSRMWAATSSKPACGGIRVGNRIVWSQAIHVNVPADLAFAPIRRIGGTVGWYYGRALWEARALVDRVLGGPGMRRGRRDSESLACGDTVDFWRVECFEASRKLTLVAEMKVPGHAWLDFEVEPDPGGSTIRQTAIFDPLGVFGLLYWYFCYPLHRLVFSGMLRRIAAMAVDSGPYRDEE